MATDPTFDANGMVILTLEEIRENMVDAIHASGDLGPTVSTGAHTLCGMVLDVFATGLGSAYELIEDVYQSGDVDAAEGVQQDNLEILRGATRDPEREGTVTLTLTGTPAAVIPAGKRAGVSGGGSQWALDAAATIGGGGTVDAAATCTEAGPITAAAGAITEIVDAVAGWTGVTNAADALPGVDVESDTTFRARGATVSSGSTTEDAIYSRLVELDDVDNAVVISNRSTVTDALGTPAHTMWIVVWPNTADQAGIAAAIWGEAGAPAGIGFRGAVTATVTDANGYQQQIKWDWATEVAVHVKEYVSTDADYPVDGDDLIEDGIVAYGDTLQVGQNVNPAPVDNATFDASPGIVTMLATLKVGSTPAVGDTSPITIAVNELGVIDSANVTVVST